MLEPITMLDRAPGGLRRFAYRVAAGEGISGRLADAVRFRFSESQVPSLPNLSEAAVRLLIGPANSAGQGYLWSRAIEEHLPGVAAIAMQGIKAAPFLPDTDLRVPVAVYQRSESWHVAFEKYLERQTHVIWESGLPLLGRQYRSDAAVEIARLRDRGVHGALLFHGSDIRVPSLHVAENHWSPFRDSLGPVHALEEGALKNAALVSDLGIPAFVSTPDLLRWLPDATWCPVVVDAAVWRGVLAKRTSSGPPVVAHAPTQKWMKGTDRIEPMLRRLSEEGVIEYRQVVDVPHASMPSFYANSDVVLDQFLLGSYGVSACEALASGRIVMGHVDDLTRAQVLKLTGMELPVHEATIESLETELRRVASEPEAFETVRARGPSFVEAVHSGRHSATALAPFLGLNA